ncbi:MAG TPA: YCF48-related protein [Terriglobales bacterium]|nr:YCF48-related protein [Terriglobales bacterium]
MKLTKARTTLNRKALFVAVWMLLVGAAGRSQQLPGKMLLPHATASLDSPAPEQKYKGIWEPVNYKEDLRLSDVFFVTPEEGWVSGDSATILHTTDGGQTWTVQLGGDPQSPERGINALRFLDQKHGWAVQDAKLLGTSDGENWEPVGTIAPGMRDYQFISPKEGVALSDSGHIYRTKDGGRTWSDVVTCKLTAEINGLKQTVGCALFRLRFSSPSVGYAVGGSDSCTGGAHPLVMAKTEDGGESWRIFVGPGEGNMSFIDGVFFLDERNGYVRVNTCFEQSKLYATSDAGDTWHGLVASPGPDIRFADPEVGWSFESTKLIFTTDGGKHWSSRVFNFPAKFYAFSLPRRDRGYIAGEHGMVYRYRVVPINYSAKGMMDAPLMPTYGGPLLGHLQDMKAQVAALKAKLGAGTGTPTSSVSSLPRILYGGGPDAEDSTALSTSSPQAGQTTQASGGFVQDTSTAPPSPYVQNCCAPQVQSMQGSFGSFSQEVPNFGNRYRSLNLVMAGLNLASSLLGKRNQIGNAFGAFKQATDAQSAGAALNDLSGKLDSTHQDISRGYSNFSFTGATAGVPGALQNAATGTLNPNAAPATTQPGAPAADQATQDAKKAADDLKKKLKKKLPF